MAKTPSPAPEIKLPLAIAQCRRRDMAKTYHWLIQLLGDEGFTQTVPLVVATASIFALVFDAPVEIVAGMIVI
jgi:hypothetical protein